MLPIWMETNNTTKWSVGLKFVQAIKKKEHLEINCLPGKAMFDVSVKLRKVKTQLCHVN